MGAMASQIIQPHECLLNRLFRHRLKKTSKLRITGLCEGNSPVTGEFPAQMASNAENVSISWHHHVLRKNMHMTQFISSTTGKVKTDGSRWAKLAI